MNTYRNSNDIKTYNDLVNIDKLVHQRKMKWEKAKILRYYLNFRLTDYQKKYQFIINNYISKEEYFHLKRYLNFNKNLEKRLRQTNEYETNLILRENLTLEQYQIFLMKLSCYIYFERWKFSQSILPAIDFAKEICPNN